MQNNLKKLDEKLNRTQTLISTDEEIEVNEERVRGRRRSTGLVKMLQKKKLRDQGGEKHETDL